MLQAPRDSILPWLPTGQALAVPVSALCCPNPALITQECPTMTTSALLSTGMVLGPSAFMLSSCTGQPTCALEKLHFTDTEVHVLTESSSQSHSSDASKTLH